MKLAYNIRFLVFLLVVASCSLSKRQTTDEVDISGSHKIDLIVLDPGHFHASLLQKETLTDVSDTIRIYAPEGIAVNQYLESIDSYISGRNLLRHGKNKYIPEMIISRKCLPIIKVI